MITSHRIGRDRALPAEVFPLPFRAPSIMPQYLGQIHAHVTER
jgi:hypothetical protein